MVETPAPDGLDEVVEELYAVEPSEFVARRTAAVAEAKAAGDKALAKAIGSLRRPARSAYVLNQLVRAEPDVADELGTLGEELREAERQMQGAELRRLSAQRNKVVDQLVTQALRAATVRDADADLRREVQETLTAALAEPAVLEGLRTGALVKPVAWSGFGVSALDDLTAVPVGSRPTAKPKPAGTRAARSAAEEEEPAAPAKRPAASAERGKTGRERAAEREQERRRREHEERVADADRDLAEAEVVYAAAKAEAADAAAEVARLEAALRDARSEAATAQKETNAARRTRDAARTALTRMRARRP